MKTWVEMITHTQETRFIAQIDEMLVSIFVLYTDNNVLMIIMIILLLIVHC